MKTEGSARLSNIQCRTLLICIWTLLTVAAPNALAEVRYSITDLGALAGTSSYATAINVKGQITGYITTSDGVEHAFLYSNGSMQLLDAPVGNNSAGLGINDSGQVVGRISVNGDDHAFLWSNGSKLDLGSVGGGAARAHAINASGQVVGGSRNTDGKWVAFLFSNGSIENLGTLGGSYSYAHAINAKGQVVGYAETGFGAQHAFVYSSSTMVDLGTLGGGYSWNFGINDSGQICGWSTIGNNLPSDERAFLYSNGSMHDLGTLGFNHSVGQGMNSSGQVVGYLWSPGVQHAFLYDGTTLQDLNSLIPVGAGWTLNGANAINDNGQIVGYGRNTSGEQHAFLLTPVPTHFTEINITPPTTPGSAPIFNLQFQSTTTDDYLLQFKDTVADTVWKWLQIIPGTGGLRTFAEELVTKSRFYRLQKSGKGFLIFPIKGLSPSTASISAVFDHAKPGNCADGTVIAFTGEIGQTAFGNSKWSTAGGSDCTDAVLYGFRNAARCDFVLTGRYSPGEEGPEFLYYDGHTGYDYPYGHDHEVVAAAGGTVHKPIGTDDYNTIWIDHGNTYSTWYLHMRPEDTAGLTDGTTVTQGQRLGYCGDYYKKVGGVPNHLHFTVKKVKVRVDPYGWSGEAGSDPSPVDDVPGHDNVILWTSP